MARRKSGGEGGGNAILVVFLVLFILSTIALGVMYWTGRESAAAGAAAEKKATTDINAAKDAQELAELKVKLYRVFTGTGTADDATALQNAQDKHKTALREEHQKLMEAANTAIATAVTDVGKTDDGKRLEQLGLKFKLTRDELFNWAWPQNGALPAKPAPGPLLDRLTRVVAERERTFGESVVQRENARSQADAYKAEVTKYTTSLGTLQKQVDDQIKKLADAIAAVEKEKGEAIGEFVKKGDDYRKDLQVRARQVEETKTVLGETQTVLANVKGQLQVMLDRQNEIDQDQRGAFAVNVPHGRVVGRKGGEKIVEIDIGSAAGLRPGQTFTVQPASARTEGLTRRRKQTYDDQGRLVISDELHSKGSIEVVEVLGPNLSTARITDETDDIRDSILKGDLLYNPLFKKNARDHVVLVGIFDTDADGIDDITTVARNLAKRGAIVDGYFDLSTGKWESLDPANSKPGPGANTTYVVRGWDADPPPGDPLLKARGDLRTLMNTALTEAKLKGAQEIRAIKFLSEIGYSVSPSISDESVNAALVKYIKDIAPPPNPK
jgi:hypothetical protein